MLNYNICIDTGQRISLNLQTCKTTFLLKFALVLRIIFNHTIMNFYSLNHKHLINYPNYEYTIFMNRKGCKRVKQLFHEQLRFLREERNLSLEELSKLSQIGVEKLTQYEKGERIPSLQTILKLSNVLEVPPSNLLDGIKA